MGPRRWPLLWCLHAALVHSTALVGGQLWQDGPPRAAGWSPAPSSSWAPTSEPGASRDPEGSAAALAFLQTGDVQQLARANCSRGVVAGAPGPGPPPALRAALRAAPEALAQAANFLNMLFQTNDIREASVAEDVEWYQALVRSLAEGHPWVRRAVLALDAHPLAAKPRLMLQATKGDGEILLRDVSAAAPGLGNLSWDNEWFNALKSQRTLLLRKRVLSNDLRSMETPKWQRGDSYVGEAGHVRWSPPFLECRDGRFLPAWAVTLSSAFYGLKPDLSPEFKGVVRVDVELRDVAIDQCASGPGWFADTHRCDLNSTQCVPQESRGFVLGRYLCRCKPGFYGAGGVASGARAGAPVGADGGSRLACRPCRQGCATCEDDAPCLIQEDRVLRAAVLSCQACCMLAVFLSMLVSYHFRRSKRIRASGVVLLETILFGSLLLYFPVFILYFKPSIFRCIVLRWVRMLGFAIVYGTITLKLYRVLKVFLSRTAQRAPYVSSGRVLKMLGLILLLVLWFLAAWTIGMLENIDRNIPLVIRTQTARGLHFYICGHDHWDYMMVIAEMLFLLWGSFLCYATRAVPSAFHEPRYMGIALHNELMMSAAFHVVRFIMVPSLHPDWTLLLFFAHTHGTITMTLALLFIPKFLHAGSPLREEIAAEVYEDELDLRRSGSCLNSSIASAWSEHSLDPDDIREELKKLYTQLEVHKTRRMAANNPHLPKKRSSRRSLGRSIARRIAELPEALGHRSSGSERVGTPVRRGSSAKRLPDAGGASLRMRDEGSRRRAAATRRSRSSEGPARERRGGSPSEPASETTAATASEQSDSESLDTAPLVCKSASAHNLAGHVRPPSPCTAPLQKSLSVVAGAREEALLAARRAAREEWHANRHPSAPSLAQGPPREAGKPPSPGVADALPPAGSSPAEGCSQEDTSPLGDAKAQNHVTYAPVKSVSIDSSHIPGRVRVAVRRTPPPPPIRYQSLGQRAAPAGDSLGPAEPPTNPPVRAGQPTGTPEGTAEEEPGPTSPPAEKGRGLPAASIPAQVCPWELVQEEILSRKQKATEAADAGTTGDAATALPSLQPPSQKTSLRGLGLAIRALNRARGKSGLRGSREGEGSLRKRGRERDGGSRRDRPSLAETLAVSLGGLGRDPTAKSPAWSRQRPGSEPTARPWPGEMDSYQHNNNASAAWEAVGWGDGGAAGPWGSPAPGMGDGEKLAEQPSAPQRDVDASGGPEIPSGVHEIPPSAGHQGRDEHPCESPVVAGSGKAPVRPRPGAEGPGAQPGQDAPVAAVRLSAPKEEVAGPSEGHEGGSGSIQPRDHAEVEQPGAKPVAGSPGPPAAGARRAAAEEQGAEVCPQGAPGVPAGRGALLRQEAIASREDSAVPSDRESPAEAAEKGGTQPKPPAAGGSRGTGVSPAAPGIPAGRQERVCPGEIQADSSIKTEIFPWEESRGPGRAPGKGGSEGHPGRSREEPGAEKPPGKTPELPKAGGVGGGRAEVCPWEAGEGGKAVRAEICPWDAEGAQPEREGEGGERRRLGTGVRNIRPKSLGLLRARESGSSPQAPGRPWDSAGSEGPPPKSASKSSELPEASARASVCPWEAAGAAGDAEVCPRERGTAVSDAGKLDDGDTSHEKKGISPQKVAPRGTAETAPVAEKGSGQGGSLGKGDHPGKGAEEPDLGLTGKHPVLPKTAPEQAGAIDGRKGDICPWEMEDEPRAKTEICPWEEPAATLGKERRSQDKREASKGENKPGSGVIEEIKAKLAEMGARPERRDSRTFAKLPRKSQESSKAESKKSQSVDSIKEEVCPWESLGTEQPPEKPRARSPALPKSPSAVSQSVGSLKAEVCPWDAPEGEVAGRAEICPWEAAAPPSDQPKATLGPGGASKGDKRITRQAALASPVRSLEKGSSEREAVCPWESLGTEQLPEKPRAGSPGIPKSPSSASQSVESLKAEVCPWEAQEVKSRDKAEICPWEVAAPLPEKGAAPAQASLPPKKAGASKSEEKGSREREAVCPWESQAMEQPPEQRCARSPALPKSPSEKSQSVESLKAEVCPWEVDAPPPGKEKSREDKDGLSMLSRSPSTSQGLCKGIGESAAAKKEKGSRDRESVCPWESTDTEGPSAGFGTKSAELLTASAKKSESVWSLKAEVCPWESLGTEQPPEKPRARSPALPKSPSAVSQSVESLKAEVCPWEAREVKSSDKAEICPWEVAAPLPEKGAAPGQASLPPKRAGASKSEEKGSREREAVCPWESQAMEQPPEQCCARSPALPKSPSAVSQSAESLKAEVCPWEAPEGEATGRAEICPWEAAAPPSDQPKATLGPGGASKGDKRITRQAALASPGRSLEKGSSEREAVCPWESLGTEQLPEKPRAGSPGIPKSPSSASQSVESLKAEVCPWEAQEVKSRDKAEICPWEAAAPLPEKGAAPAQASLPLKKVGASKSEEKGSRERDAVCPWESQAMEQPPGKPHTRSPALPKSPSEKSQSVKSLKAEVCPWEAPEVKPTDKAEICPWEVDAPPPGKEKSREDKDGLSMLSRSPSTSQGLCKGIGESAAAKKEKGSRDRESVCPWESTDTEGHSAGFGTKSTELLTASAKKSESVWSLKAEVCPWESLGTEQPPEKPRARSPAIPKSPSSASQSVESLKAEVCPWEAREVKSSDKAEICPWEVAAPLPEKGAAPGQASLPPKRAGASKSEEKGSREREAVCPWESQAMEQPPEQCCARSPALPKSPSAVSQSAESLKAEVCPWEAPEGEATGRAEICPWEAAAPPSDQPKATLGPGGASKGDKRITRQAALASPVRSLEKGSSEREAVCPWESLGTEQPPEKPRAGSPAIPKSPSSASQSVESLKAEVCPWEAQEVKSRDKAEICPWEVAAPLPEKGAAPAQASLPPKKAGASKSEEKGSREREAVCPWESQAMEQPPEQRCARSPALPKSSSKKSQSVESLKAEVCPWEVDAPPPGKEKSREDKDGLSMLSRSPSTSQGLCKGIGESAAAKKEKGSRDRESVCPWESTDTEGPSTGFGTKSAELLTASAKKSESVWSLKAEVCPWESLGTEQPPEKPRARSPALPKSPSAVSQSVESLKAEVCPWEAREVKSSDKAEICPWEVAAPLPEKGAAPAQASLPPKRAGASKSEEKGSREREAVCPWESQAMEQPPGKPHTRSPALPKSPSEKSQSVESLKAEVCPWEAPEVKPTDKAEICPWEVDAPPPGKEKSREDKDGLSMLSRSPSTSHGLCKGIGESAAAKKEKGSRDRESVCPWESTDTEGPSAGFGTKSAELLTASAKKSESVGSLKAEVCPWESLGTEQPPEKPRSRSPVISKSPSAVSQSVESLKAEVCPWEAPEGEATGRAEICPWEAAAPPSDWPKATLGPGGASKGDKRITRQAALASPVRSLEKGSSEREAVCPWESLGTEQLPEKPRAGSPAIPKSPSSASQSVESLKAEVCPWEAQEVKSRDKAEICPWEVAAPLPEKGAAPAQASLPLKKVGASKSEEKGSREREAICPWESTGTAEPSLKSAMGKEPSKRSDSTESRKSDICPWEAAEPTHKPGMCPQGDDGASPIGTGKSKLVAGASTLSPTALQKKSKGRSVGEAEHKPLCRIVPSIQPPRGPGAGLLPQGPSTAPAAGSGPSPTARVAEVCPWEAEGAPPASDKTSTDTRKTSDVCPWEAESADPTPTPPGQGRARASPQDSGRGASETKPGVCPRDHE